MYSSCCSFVHFHTVPLRVGYLQLNACYFNYSVYIRNREYPVTNKAGYESSLTVYDRVYISVP
jgi:hypothetical protein